MPAFVFLLFSKRQKHISHFICIALVSLSVLDLLYVIFNHHLLNNNEKFAMNKTLRHQELHNFLTTLFVHFVRTYIDCSTDYTHDFTLHSKFLSHQLFLHHIHQKYWTIKFCHVFGVKKSGRKSPKQSRVHSAWNPCCRCTKPNSRQLNLCLWLRKMYII